MICIQGSVPVGNTEADYISFGQGKEPMAVLSGLDLRGVRASSHRLMHLYRLFAEEYTVYCIDRKRRVPAAYTIGELACDTAEAMRALHLEAAYVLGISQGGMIGQELAIRFPELVKKLAVGVSLSKRNSTLEACIQTWVSLAEKGDFEAMQLDFVQRIYSQAYLRKYRRVLPLLTGRAAPDDPARFISLAKSCLTCDTFDRLGEIRCPVFVIGGAQDRVVTGEASSEMAEKLRCELYLYPEFGHSAFEEAPDFNERILGFFRGDSSKI